jgi:hypothetical protein
LDAFLLEQVPEPGPEEVVIVHYEDAETFRPFLARYLRHLRQRALLAKGREEV